MNVPLVGRTARQTVSRFTLPQGISHISKQSFIYASQTICSQRYYSTPILSNASKGPLDGVRILDFTRILAGPFCTMILADYGADVIKVEQAGHGDETRQWKASGEDTFWKPGLGPISIFYSAINRNKRSLTVDLKQQKGKEIIHRLIKDGDIDVVVENYVPGTGDRLGIGYKELSRLNPRLIYASLSGYGHGGPYEHRAGYDAIAAAEAAFMHLNGHPDSAPARAPLGTTDMSTGLFTHGAIAAALYSREKSGRGQHISASLFETQIAMLVNVGGNWLNRQVEGQRFGAGHPSVVPYNAWKCRNGIWIVIAANSQRQYENLCKRIERPDLITDERFKNNSVRVKNRKVLDKILADELVTRTSDEWMKILDGSGLAHGPINTVQKAMEHPQTVARDMIQEREWDALTGGQWKTIGPAVKFSETKATVRALPAQLGEHSEAVLQEAGYQEDEIEEMREAGVL